MRIAHIALFSTIDFEGTRLNVLAERASMTKQGMGQLTLDLERIGYVKRTVDPTDRRAKVVRFTEAGWKVMLDSQLCLREIEAAWRAIIGERAIAELRRTLTMVREHMPLFRPEPAPKKSAARSAHPKYASRSASEAATSAAGPSKRMLPRPKT